MSLEEIDHLFIVEDSGSQADTSDSLSAEQNSKIYEAGHVHTKHID